MREEIQETEVERDADGRVVGYKQSIERPRRSGGFGWGLMLGVLIVALGIGVFAYNQGSFQQAGVEADQATVEASQTLQQTAEQAGDAAKDAGNRVENATDTPAAPDNSGG